MRRVVVALLIISLGQSSAALAGETVLGAAARIVREAAQKQTPSAAKSAAVTQAQRVWTAPTLAATIRANESAALAQEQGALSTSGLRKRTKIMIFLGTAIGIAGAAYVIDHKVEDNTPSSHGLRED